MSLLVRFQLTHAGVHASTLFACEVAVLVVGQLMFAQQVHFLKAFTALGAVKRFGTMNTLVLKFLLY